MRLIQHLVKKGVFVMQNSNRLTTLLSPTKAWDGLLCITHVNAEVERSLSENSKILTSEQSILCDDSINTIKLTKEDI